MLAASYGDATPHWAIRALYLAVLTNTVPSTVPIFIESGKYCGKSFSGLYWDHEGICCGASSLMVCKAFDWLIHKA